MANINKKFVDLFLSLSANCSIISVFQEKILLRHPKLQKKWTTKNAACLDTKRICKNSENNFYVLNDRYYTWD